ncbi:MAG: TIGR03619 family F420-dependent LLM class oxidoreductase [Dehalococcoidia bacterium]
MSIRIGLGVAGFPWSSADAFLDWVDLCEDSDVDSVWFSERLVSSQPTLEPMVAMSLLAGRTRRLKFGMNAIVLPLRDPLVLAKECATLDYLSGGRLLPAFGVGRDTAPEFRATSNDGGGRGERSNEMLQLLSRLWSEEHVSFKGRYYDYEDTTISPRPVQQPLPLWIGGSSAAAIKRTALYGSGWLGGLQSPAQVAPIITAIKAAVAEAGRTIDEAHYGAGFSYRFGSWDEPVVQQSSALLSRIGEGLDPSTYMAVGGAGEIIARAREYVEAGVSKFVLRPIGATDEEIMEQTRRLADEVLPAVHDAAWEANRAPVEIP